jgi:site-specific DNA-cytosine methylase
VEEVRTLWFTKGRRAQNEEDYETWIEGGVMPTLNAFDNGDIRTTVIVFHPHRSDGFRLQGDIINTLTAFMGTGGNNVSMVAKETTVRRLTPVECERLQGFPDDWTAGQSDSARYKQMGNAVAVPVVEWLIQNIVDVANVS